jgi:hypothetical protein
MISGFVSHLWQSTLCSGAAWFLVLALRRHRAQARYWVWFIASTKFLVPFSLLVGLGAFVPWRAGARPSERGWVAVAEQVRPLASFCRETAGNDFGEVALRDRLPHSFHS